MKKNKTIGVILAVFFGYWAYIYSYQEDSQKFWTYLILNLLLFWTIIIPIYTYIKAIIDMINKKGENWD